MPLTPQNTKTTGSTPRSAALAQLIPRALLPAAVHPIQARGQKPRAMTQLPPGRNNSAPLSRPTHMNAAVSSADSQHDLAPTFQDDHHWVDLEVRSEYNKKFHHAQPSPADQQRARDDDMRNTLYYAESNQAVPAGMVPTAHLDVFRNPHFAQQMQNPRSGAQPIHEFVIMLPNGMDVPRSRSEVEMHVMIERVIAQNVNGGTRGLSSHPIQIGSSDLSSTVNTLRTAPVTTSPTLQEEEYASENRAIGDDDHQWSLSPRGTSGLTGEGPGIEQAGVEITPRAPPSEYFSTREDSGSSGGTMFSVYGDPDGTTSGTADRRHVPMAEPVLTASTYVEVNGSWASSLSGALEPEEDGKAEGSGKPEREHAKAAPYAPYSSGGSSTSSQARKIAPALHDSNSAPHVDVGNSDRTSSSGASFRGFATDTDARLNIGKSTSEKSDSPSQQLTKENLAIAARLARDAAPTMAWRDFGKDCWNAAANETSETDLALSTFICDLAAQHSGAALAREHFVSAAAISAAEFLEANLTDGTEEAEPIDTPPEIWRGWQHWLDCHNLQLCENHGNGGTNARMNCLLHSIIQHASGDYAPENPIHIHFAELLRAGLIAHKLSEPPQANGDNQLLFADGAALNWALPLINQAYGTDLQVLTFYAGSDQAGNVRPLKGGDSLRFGETSSGKQKVALLFQDDHFVGLIRATH